MNRGLAREGYANETLILSRQIRRSLFPTASTLQASCLQ